MTSPRITFTYSGPSGLDDLLQIEQSDWSAYTGRVTKGGMILRLASLLGVARKDIYCIGDHNNDIPMLEVSEIGFAPENAIPEVKEWGAHIVCHCKDGALADVVEILNRRY